MKPFLPARVMMVTLLGACSVWLLHASLPQVQAQPAPILTSVNWRSLSASQKAALEPLADRWPHMTPEHQRKWLAISSNYRQLSGPEQERLHERMLTWAKMSSAQRMQTRRNYDNARETLSADQRRARWDAYKNLGDDERDALMRKGNPVRLRGTAPAVQAQPLKVKLPEPKKPH